MSDENREIMSECDKAIILSGNLDAVDDWKRFCQECGLEVITVLHSDYHGNEDNIESSPMVVHHLERGEDVSARPAIQRVAEMILRDIKVKEVKRMKAINKEGLLEIATLAEVLGKIEIERTLPNGRVVRQIVWEGKDLAQIAEMLHNHSAEMSEVVKIDGAAPAWLVAALAHECHPRSIALNSPDGFVAVGCQRPKDNGQGIGFTVETREDGWTLITFQLNPSSPLSPEDLGEIAPPELPMGAKVIISGRGPNWLVASLVMAYHGRTKAVACFQPGTGSTVCMTHSATVELGEVILEQ
jgi:CRISPR-associated Csx3 family protein